MMFKVNYAATTAIAQYMLEKVWERYEILVEEGSLPPYVPNSSAYDFAFYRAGQQLARSDLRFFSQDAPFKPEPMSSHPAPPFLAKPMAYLSPTSS
jgi:hypothetical protein